MARLPLTTASYVARSLKASAQRCVNLYPEANPADAPAPVTFYGTPGTEVWSTLPGSGPVRCLYRASNGVLFAVQGMRLYRYDGLGSWIDLAGMATSTGPVNAADNGNSAVFVDGTLTAPTVNLGNYAVGAMSGDGWLGSAFVWFVDERLVFFQPGTQKYFWTGLLSLAIDPLDFASAEGMPDPIVSMIADHRELWFLGEETMEVYSSSGDATLPFVRYPAGFNHYGCEAKYSVAALDNTIYWLGKNKNGGRMVLRAQNYQPQAISTPAISEEFAKYDRVDDAIAWAYQQDGHPFYVLTFPSASKTWAYDVLTGQWHERAYRTAGNDLIRHRGNCAVFFGGENLVGDFEDGRIYRLDLDVYSDDGAPIARQKDFPHIVTEGRKQFFSRFTLDCEVAVGNPNDEDPQILLSWSDDGGNSWSNPIQMSLGRVGAYQTRARANRLGAARDRVWRVYTAAKAKVAFQGAFAEAAAGTS
ncbi:conserved hypothetical protein [Cupriavidus phytorum]|uniref:Bacteriophage P22, Gp10, DNA-stabilising n=1 Tax=Cupriavidus taiwanensis TaxID=164546 RepID=A0A975XBY1_9BURK|nr:hypothetical protein [Cupriavidus taiwanensis]SOY65593.1 conserved hypothetical protein [Cupriavidus taiwanensis]